MLSKLFGSRARVKLLKNFLLHPEEKYYIRQLSRDLGLQLNSVRRELENLEEFGLLSSFTSDSLQPEDVSEIPNEIIHAGDKKSLKRPRDKNKKEEKLTKQDKKYFQVNTNFVLYEEVKSLIVKSQVLYERDFVDKILKLGKIKLFILTGFFANNTDTPVDILIVGRVNKEKIKKVINELEKELVREIYYTVFDPKEFKYRRDMTDVFLYHILEGEKIVIYDELDIMS